MAFNFRNLDPTTRTLMIEEIDAAIADGNLYFSKRFTDAGHAAWPNLLKQAAREHNEQWLAFQIEANGFMKGLEGSRTPSGGYTTKHVPHTAAETMAEGQFNRYYILGGCRRAVEADGRVTVYRAKDVLNPRPESQALVGASRDAAKLIEQIRPVDSSLRHELLKPNSGLTVQL